nr:Asp-tRNA(Asn)/Glu-tRNA(Gln) amidotransferase GatCAB subunit A [Anaerolineae bacterium]
MSDLTQLTISEARTLLVSGEITSVELTNAFLDRIEEVEPIIQAYLTVTAEKAIDQAKNADARRRAGERIPLLGIPLAYKDVLTTEGIETTCGSRILKGYIPPYTATAIARLETAGAVMLGKTNMDEF